MTNLSPATSAILDAYWEAFNAPLEGAVHRPLAAALRAVAEQVLPLSARRQLLAMAAELEGNV
jgi:hypothetical protein